MSFSRPQLKAEKQKIYTDAQRSAQVLGEMHRFYRDERLCDIIICVEGCRFNCHRLVLAASSLYFERMFSNGMTEANAKEVTLNDVSAGALHHLIDFAYTSTLSITKDTALDIFEAADMLQFPTVRMFCQDFLADQICAHNCLHFLLYADAYSCDPLYEKAKLVAAKHFKLLCSTEEFLKVPVIHLVALMKEDNIEMEYEEHVYEAMKRWVLYDQHGREKYLAELFKCIRLNFVSRWYLIEIISNDELINASEEARMIVQRAKDQLLAQGHTYEIPWQLPPSRKCTGMTEKIVYLNTHDPNPKESELYLFDTVNNSWSNTSKPCPLASEMSTCETLGDALLIIGGWNNNVGSKSLNHHGAVNIIHEFRVMTIFPTLWYVGAHPMGISRYLHSSIVVGNRLYLLGGIDETQSLQATMYVTDQDQHYQFDVCPRMLYPVCRPAVAHHDNKLYVIGGYFKDGTPIHFVQQFDLITQKWLELPSIEGLNIACQYATCINGLVYLICGDIGDTARHPKKEKSTDCHTIPPKFFDAIRTYDPITKYWDTVFYFPEPRTGNFCITCLDNKIYITGGEKDGKPYGSVDCFDPVTNQLEVIGTSRDGCLSLCATMKVMHENFGL